MLLRLDWCDPAATRYACRHWHYSATRPTSPSNDIGVWEDGHFIGAILFSLGASGTLGAPFGLHVREWAELTRVALRSHQTPVSRLLAIAIRLLRAKNPALRLLISFADPFHGHTGAIYQAAGWIYTGTSARGFIWRLATGALAHDRRFSGKGFNARRAVPMGAQKIATPGKHRYVLPLDAAMRRTVQPMAKPYPKRERSRDNAAAPPSAEGGVIPTRSLQP
jgi:hypothetical protein